MSCGNSNGRCQFSETWLSREAKSNASGDAFRTAVSSFPVIGGLVAGLVPDSLTQNVVRECPGAVYDHVSSYRLEYSMMGVIVALIVLYLIVK